ncbi:unnamed protein product [Didymodactylos carnosus]|uniref:SH3 domain-containing protein n=1 Tax=Didymodactylos carnosus TaxID=1234261 RepID=A0A8S2HV59_9BILA|nr:unnamed protein product [Didymodactylos carnosus]CAF3689574.1 unnamed protein product [Didymodactylos carnosus]
MQQFFQDVGKKAENFLADHPDAKTLVENAQKGARNIARKTEQRLGFHETKIKGQCRMGNCLYFGRPNVKQAHHARQTHSHFSHTTNHNTASPPPPPSSLSPSSLLISSQIASPNGKNEGDTFSNIKPPSSPTFRPSSSGASATSSLTPQPFTIAALATSVPFAILNGGINPLHKPTLQYIALFDYDARTSEDLTIRKNDLLEIICKRNNAWWKARSETGKEGYIPSNHVAKRDSLESEPYVFDNLYEEKHSFTIIHFILDGISK